MALLVKCEPVVQKQHDHALNIVTHAINILPLTKYYNFTKYCDDQILQ